MERPARFFTALRMTDVAPVPSPRKRLFSIIKWTLCAAIVAWVGVVLYRQVVSIDWATVTIRPAYVLGAAIAIALVTVTQFVAYRLLLSAYGPVPSWPATATLSWLPALGKYVPGKVVAISGTVYLLRKFRIPAAVASSVALMGDALAVLTGLIVGRRCSAGRPCAKNCPAAGSPASSSSSAARSASIRGFSVHWSTSRYGN